MFGRRSNQYHALLHSLLDKFFVLKSHRFFSQTKLDNLSENIDTTKAYVDELCDHNTTIKQKHNENAAKHNQMKLATKTGGSRKRRRRKRRGLKNKSMKR